MALDARSGRRSPHHKQTLPGGVSDRYLRRTSDFATSRALSIKSCVTGLSVRYFSVTIPLGTRAIGSSTGRTFSSKCWVGNINAEVGKIVRKRPVAKRLMRTWGESVTTVVRG